MDLNQNCTVFSCNGEQIKINNFRDTTLRLDCFGYGGNNADVFGKSRTNLGDRAISSRSPDDGCRLVLGLGPTPSIYSDVYEVNKNKEASTLSHQGLFSRGDSVLKLGLSGGTVKVMDVLDYSVSSQADLNAFRHPDQASVSSNRLMVPVADEGSTSAKKSGGYMPTLLLAPRLDSSKIFWQTQKCLEPETKSYSHPSQLSSEPSALSDYSMGTVYELATTGTPSSYQTSNAKECKFIGCTKGARGATGLCISHGGGQRCQKPGCNKGAESRTVYCKTHGGGRRCQHLGCTKSAEGRTDHCIAHGGGRRCEHLAGCNKAARGKSGLCIKHGGGKRCNVEGCTRSAEGQVGLCISHGGGRRCQFHGCDKGAQGRTMYCKGHGGGKRCIVAGCTKGAEGSTLLCKGHGGGKRCLFNGGGICPKSVHGGTNFCVAHGGGKRCAVPGCTKSARGRTDCCVKHGGGKRCKFENCGKSAQGSTNFCKAHGGGKRCNWEVGKCEKFARGRNGLCAAHSSMAQDGNSKRRDMIGPGLFHGLVLAVSSGDRGYENTHYSSGLSVPSDSIDSLEMPAERQLLIPPQVLVPSTMKSPWPSTCLRPVSSEKHSTDGGSGCSGARKGCEFAVPEGRVHGGGLLSLLGGDLKNAIDGI